MSGYEGMFYLSIILLGILTAAYSVLRVYLHRQKKKLEEGDER